MFGAVKRLCAALECLTSATEALRESVVVARDWHAEHGNVEARVEELERQRHLFESEVHGELLKSQAEYKKAGNAEKRAQNARDEALGADEDGADGLGDLAERYAAWLLSHDAAGGKMEQVPPMHEAVGATASVVDSLKARKRVGRT